MSYMVNLNSLVSMFSMFKITSKKWGPPYNDISEDRKSARDSDIHSIWLFSHRNAKDFDDDLLSAMRRVSESMKTDLWAIHKRVAAAVLRRTGITTGPFINDDFRDVREDYESEHASDTAYMEGLRDADEDWAKRGARRGR
ncbi:unnamed protein product [Zymoseptoria tritici ST99CH_1E4]|uniref:Uncharacterized protein n=1 Tax=Zymoseptoria tritici ST99CH_1E4 TaxID=1276532 RepID=A0A2H1H475_ZYMTR|nr:unnamed protein product [Zymoseptoria tritici ST99CH_1E4]